MIVARLAAASTRLAEFDISLPCTAVSVWAATYHEIMAILTVTFVSWSGRLTLNPPDAVAILRNRAQCRRGRVSKQLPSIIPADQVDGGVQDARQLPAFAIRRARGLQGA